MANITSSMSLWVNEEPKDKEEARTQFLKQYPGIVYLEESDSYFYRGYEFDYFKSGVNIFENGPDSYLLVDKLDNQLWLFTYGDPEDRWDDYIKLAK